jgi:hypothetical protein
MHEPFRRAVSKPFELGERADIQSNRRESMQQASRGAAYIAALAGRDLDLGLAFA